MPTFYQDIYTVVSCIPEGKVATYGQVARLAGKPNGARQVGYALAALKDPDVPWQRVVNARGEISPRAKSGYEEYQRILLEEEGIEFGLNGKIDLSQFLWEA